MYNSFSFQMLTFSLIMLGFVLDMAEAQVMCVSRARGLTFCFRFHHARGCP